VDLALSMVIIFLLGALTIRALVFVHDAASLALLGRRRRPTGDRGSPGAGPERR